MVRPYCTQRTQRTQLPTTLPLQEWVFPLENGWVCTVVGGLCPPAQCGSNFDSQLGHWPKANAH